MCFECFCQRHTTEEINRLVIYLPEILLSVQPEGCTFQVTVTPKWAGRLSGKEEWLVGIGGGAIIVVQDKQINRIIEA